MIRNLKVEKHDSQRNEEAIVKEECNLESLSDDSESIVSELLPQIGQEHWLSIKSKSVFIKSEKSSDSVEIHSRDSPDVAVESHNKMALMHQSGSFNVRP